MADRVGQQLGNYRLIRMLGEGGFAEVYLGEHIHLGTRAAIKVLHTQLTNDDVEKFRTEARTIAHLVHPNIVRVLEFGVEGKTPFLVMDFAPNGTVRQRHPKGNPLPLATIVSYVKQVAEALQYAHDTKLIHRDVKPENMLLGGRGEVLLSDFGIALVVQSSRYQSTQDLAGTMAYMAPEQIQGKPRPASDQYSLGIVVYEWLSGDRPFHGSFTEIVGQHLSVPPPSLRGKVPTILPDVEHVVMAALAKEPRERFTSVQAFATALEQASQSDFPTFVKPPMPVAQQPGMTTPTSQAPQSTVGITPPNQGQPPDVMVTPPIWPPQSTTGTILSGGQHGSTQMSQIGGFAQPPQSKKSPQFGLIIGTLLLLVTLIGGSIFFFAMNKGNTSVGSNSPASVPTSAAPATSAPSGPPIPITASPLATATLKHVPNGMADLSWDPATQDLTVKVSLVGLAPSSMHPAHIHTGSCANQGNVIYPLQTLAADAHGVATATTVVKNVTNGIPATGWYVNVHNGPGLSTNDQFLPIVCGDVANSSAAQTVSVMLTSAPPASMGESVSGMAQLTLSGTTLTVKLTLSGLEPNSMHAAHIHAGSCESQGPVVYPLNTVVADAAGNASETTTATVANPTTVFTTSLYVNVHHSTALSTQTGFDPIACGNVTYA